VLIRRRALRDGSGGAGRQRGGLGQTLDLGVRTGRRYSMAASADRTRSPAEGVGGGCSGAAARTALDTGETLDFKRTQPVPPERRVILDLAGGAGFGDPFTRDPDAVLRDVLNGFVSIDAARDDYGVVIRRVAPERETVLLPEDFVVDDAGTSALRGGASQSRTRST
jgi:N-methylhydantoinase B